MAKRVIIVGSGIVGAAMAHKLVGQGVQVDLFEKGPDYPYPHSQQFAEQNLYGHHDPSYELPPDLKMVTSDGEYRGDVNRERVMVVGGGATRWGGMTDRMHPHDFNTRSRYGYGADWPIEYHELEPYYGRAERLLGVAGSDQRDPYAAPRSTPYPLPPFELGEDSRLLTDRLRSSGMIFRTSPQARTRAAYDGRPACANFGTCSTCPLGARYSPNHHLAKAVKTGLCRVHPKTSVRRILLDASGRARGVVCRPNGASVDREEGAHAVVVAAGTVESARLLLLSRDGAHREGLGNAGGQLGQNLVFHHIAAAHLDFAETLYSGRTGPEMAQSRQFLDPPTRGSHGGVLLQLPSTAVFPFHPLSPDVTSGEAVLSLLRPRLKCEIVWLHAESLASPGKTVRLGDSHDRFGDPFAHVDYQSNEFDQQTRQFGLRLLEKMAQATRARDFHAADADNYSSGAHHMGTCRMGQGPADSVVDSSGQVHGVGNLYVAGGSVFPGCGAVHPTLTMVALALRTADRLCEALR
jgi:choline dehydrogenase-like flavoprotein